MPAKRQYFKGKTVDALCQDFMNAAPKVSKPTQSAIMKVR